jgi:hypothetical protein
MRPGRWVWEGAAGAKYPPRSAAALRAAPTSDIGVALFYSLVAGKHPQSSSHPPPPPKYPGLEELGAKHTRPRPLARHARLLPSAAAACLPVAGAPRPFPLLPAPRPVRSHTSHRRRAASLSQVWRRGGNPQVARGGHFFFGYSRGAPWWLRACLGMRTAALPGARWALPSPARCGRGRGCV